MICAEGAFYLTPLQAFLYFFSSMPVLAANGCELKARGKKYQLSALNAVRDASRSRFLFPARIVLKFVGADEYMELLIAK